MRTTPRLWGRETTLDERGRDVRDALGLAAVGVLLIAVGLVGGLPRAGLDPVGRWWFTLPLAALCALVLTKRRHPLATLTPREHDVLRCLGDGLSNAEVATALGISEATAKTHVSRVLAKLGARSRVQAAILAREHGVASAF